MNLYDIVYYRGCSTGSVRCREADQARGWHSVVSTVCAHVPICPSCVIDSRLVEPYTQRLVVHCCRLERTRKVGHNPIRCSIPQPFWSTLRHAGYILMCTYGLTSLLSGQPFFRTCRKGKGVVETIEDKYRNFRGTGVNSDEGLNLGQ